VSHIAVYTAGPLAGERKGGLAVIDWFRLHSKSLKLLVPLLLVVTFVHAYNMYGWPGRVNDDEGTYVSQAWAVVTQHTLAHYTYNYDHPPLGWLIIAMYAWVTHGFGRETTALMVGREAMLLTNVVCCALLFLLARRLGIRRIFAAVVVVVFAFSPLAMQYHRMVFLDNMSTTLTVASLVFAASPRKSLAATAGAGICFACAVLTKETAALGFPPLVWMLLQHSDKRMRSWHLAILSLIGFIGFLYPLYAMLKGEFFEGAGHVSLIGSILWQLFNRPASGSLLNPNSGTYYLARSWVQLDPWLPLLGTFLIPAGFLIRQLRPIALGLFILVVFMLRNGYMPYPYVIALLPFTALLIGGSADWIWQRWQRGPGFHRKRRETLLTTYRGSVVLVALVFAVSAIPHWTRSLHDSFTANLGLPYQEATQWVYGHIDRQKVIIVDDYVWPDLALRGYTKQVWLYKADLDPTVKATLLPNGYASVDYVVLGKDATSSIRQLPTVAKAIKHSTIVASFGDGEITVRKVVTSRRG
jgi:hypothetical protein